MLRYFVLGSLSGVAFSYLSPFTLYRVSGPSMNPTLNPTSDSKLRSDLVLVRKVSNLNAKDASGLKGSIVVLKDPRDSPREGRRGLLIKRLVATQGDTVKPLPQIRGAPDRPRLRIDSDCCWVQSDGGIGFSDSNLFGPVQISDVVGVVRMIVWPIDRFKVVEVKQHSNMLQQQ